MPMLPKLPRITDSNLDALLKNNKTLKKPFPRSTYPAAAFNLGPCVCTFKHRDHLNCPTAFVPSRPLVPLTRQKAATSFYGTYESI